jgi:inhibitor of cysteine peptidase
MKKILIFGLISILLLPLLMIGCSSRTKTNIEVTLDDFANQNNIVKDVTVSPNGRITVTLGSNAGTGYQWGDAVINDTDKVEQTSHNYIEPNQTGLTGAAGKETLTFTAKTAGSVTIKLGYSRPWEGGEKDTYTLTINVTIKA